MANARKCDICGCYYDINNEKFNKMELFTNTTEEIAENIKEFDLCPDCVDKFLFTLGVLSAGKIEEER